MTDHELLELAAKAAGYDKVFEPLGVCDLLGSWTKYVKNRQYINGREHLTYWNPLTDDGDALRLAIRLGINISTEDCSAWCRLYDSSNTLIEEYWGGDYDPCYRRAIVLAAAKIGKETP